MRQSQLFTKTRREIPADEESRNAQLLIRAGFVHKEMAGVYTFLPLGLRVLDNIAQVVREEMNELGAQEIRLTTLQDKELWDKTGRWSDVVIDDWFKTKLANQTEVGLGLTHEEPLTNLLSQYVNSYKDLPLLIYQIQSKFRNELRAKSGLLRGREFLMKDLYSFARNQKEHDQVYNQVAKAYDKIFKRLGLGDRTYRTFASGGSFAKFSDEFQTLTEAGEDTIYLDYDKKVAVNKEVYTDEVLKELGLKRDQLNEVKAAEVGNIFSLGTKYSKPLGLNFVDDNGHEQNVIMGCYGIGISRLMGVIAECFADDKGLVWPAVVAPFNVHLVRLGDSPAVVKAAEELYTILTKNGGGVLYDDRDESAGTKFADADLIGIPYRLVISDKTLESKKYELKSRTGRDAVLLNKDELLKKLA
ncbi:MAG TPA: aminoacyl--tRNA ligase-related protein [Candidatus Saccharimonadales bacterium]|nr:aminoacyl--tRNA ligase-related protein [Candidatus Saccharimonadales bacterium]